MYRRFTPSLLVLCLVAGTAPSVFAQSLVDGRWMSQATPADIQALLDRGAAVNARDEHGWTPLHLAARYNANPTVATLLLDRGADPMARAENGYTPLHGAAGNMHGPAMAGLLLARGAAVNARSKRGTPLHAAARNVAAVNGPAVAGLLLAHGAAVNARNSLDRTPLHEAWLPATFALLLDHGADVNAQEVFGWTPLHFAASGARLATVALLLDRGADINARNRKGETPLHFATSNTGEDEILPDSDIYVRIRATVGLLLDRGADVTLRDHAGKRPIDYAKENKTLKDTPVYRRLQAGREREQATAPARQQQEYVLERPSPSVARADEQGCWETRGQCVDMDHTWTENLGLHLHFTNTCGARIYMQYCYEHCRHGFKEGTCDTAGLDHQQRWDVEIPAAFHPTGPTWVQWLGSLNVFDDEACTANSPS